MNFKRILTLFLFICLCCWDCPTDDVGNEPIKNNKTVVVQLHPRYLGSCGKNIFDQASKNIEITISVDVVKTRTSKTNHKKYIFIRNNDDNHEPNLRFSGIEIPKSGTFTVTVLVNALSCFTCCFSLSCPGGSGKPFHEGNSDPIHVDDVSDGSLIRVFPIFEECL